MLISWKPNPQGAGVFFFFSILCTKQAVHLIYRIKMKTISLIYFDVLQDRQEFFSPLVKTIWIIFLSSRVHVPSSAIVESKSLPCHYLEDLVATHGQCHMLALQAALDVLGASVWRYLNFSEHLLRGLVPLAPLGSTWNHPTASLKWGWHTLVDSWPRWHQASSYSTFS